MATAPHSETDHPRDRAGRFVPKAAAAHAAATTDVKSAAAADYDEQVPDEYRWGVPDWVDRPSNEDSPTVASCPTERQALQAAKERSGEFIDITYAEPGTGSRDALGRLIPGTGLQRTARGRCSVDDSGNVIVYGEPGGSPGQGFQYGANEHIRIPAVDVLSMDGDLYTMAVGSPDHAAEMHPTGDPARPGAYYDDDENKLHVRLSDGAVVTYWPVPETHGDHLIDNPGSAHGRYQVLAVFAPDRTRVGTGNGRSIFYRLSDRTLTLHDVTGASVHPNVQPSEYASVFATKNPAAALTSLVAAKPPRPDQ